MPSFFLILKRDSSHGDEVEILRTQSRLGMGAGENFSADALVREGAPWFFVGPVPNLSRFSTQVMNDIRR